MHSYSPFWGWGVLNEIVAKTLILDIYQIHQYLLMITLRRLIQ